MTLSNAIAQFLQEFSRLETCFVGLALSSLTDDQRLLQQAQSRLQLSARLTLLKRMAMVRDAHSSSIALLEGVIEKTSRLQDKHQELTRFSTEVMDGTLGEQHDAPKRPWIPTPAEIDQCNLETLALQRMLESVAGVFSRRESI
jgi:hypothetical protein